MTAEPFGPSKKQTRSDVSFEDRRERFAEQFGFQAEPEPDPVDDFAESSWGDADSKKTMMGEYLKRHPEARPKPAKPRELLKNMGPLVAPNTTAGMFLENLVTEFRAGAERYKELESKLAAFEQKQLDECTSKPNHVWLDSEGVEISPNHPGQAPAPVQPMGMTKIVQKSRDVATRDCGNPFCLAKGQLHEHTPSGGRIDWT